MVIVEVNSVDYVKTLPEPAVSFTGEEAFGKHLDLHHIYDMFINIPGKEGHDHFI